MKKAVFGVAVFVLLSSIPGLGQLGLFSKQQRIEFTPEWHGERFADGRPKVADGVLARLKEVTADEAWDILQDSGYRNQFEPGPDVDSIIQANGKKEQRVGGENSWVIDILQPGDVLVVDLFGKIRYGTFAGDNLSTAIFAKSHNGLIVNGAVRDVTGIEEIKGFQVYVRGVDPSALESTMLMGINVPIRIGDVTVMPGDIALGDPEGLTFIPPQLAEKVAADTEMTHLVDEWGHMMLREGKYTPGQIDREWTRDMVEQFNRWLEQKGSKLRMPLPVR